MGEGIIKYIFILYSFLGWFDIGQITLQQEGSLQIYTKQEWYKAKPDQTPIGASRLGRIIGCIVSNKSRGGVVSKVKKIPGGIEPNCKLGRSSPAQADEEVSRVLNWCKGISLQIKI